MIRDSVRNCTLAVCLVAVSAAAFGDNSPLTVCESEYRKIALQISINMPHVEVIEILGDAVFEDRSIDGVILAHYRSGVLTIDTTTGQLVEISADKAKCALL